MPYNETLILFDAQGRIHGTGMSSNIMNPACTAVERADDTRECWHRGRLHRDDGPALEFRGERLTLNIPWNRIHLKGPVDLWFRRGRLHRADGPAVQDALASSFWFVDGKLHRDDGPAIEDNEANIRWWWRNGVPHREGAPAVVHEGDEMEWGNFVLFGRAELWIREGKLHRDGAPAIFDSVGNEFWYRNDKLHREDGPAVVSDPEMPAELNYRAAWFLNGKLVKEEPFNGHA